MAGVAALAEVDVAPHLLERGVEAHVGRVLHRLVDGEERRDLDGAADAAGDDDGGGEAERVALEPIHRAEDGVEQPPERGDDPLENGVELARASSYSAGTLRSPASPSGVVGRSRARCASGAWRIVIQMFQMAISVPAKNIVPPTARAT